MLRMRSTDNSGAGGGDDSKGSGGVLLAAAIYILPMVQNDRASGKLYEDEGESESCGPGVQTNLSKPDRAHE